MVEQLQEGGTLAVTRGEDLVLGEELFLSLGSEDIVIGIIPMGAGGTLATIGAAIQAWWTGTSVGAFITGTLADGGLKAWALKAGMYLTLSFIYVCISTVDTPHKAGLVRTSAH